MKEAIEGATDIVFTLGNIFYLTVDGKNVIGHLDTQKRAQLNEQTLDGTQACIEEGLRLLHEHSSARIYVTVSPVPISRNRGARYGSAMEADCASKCQLRTALSRVKGKFTYLPLFEVFKWLAPHQSFPTFGADDGNSRHIAQDQIRVVMEALT